MREGPEPLSSRTMASSSPRRPAWILLAAALALPGWVVAHALIHEHLAHHHGEGTHPHGDVSHRHAGDPAASHETAGLAFFSGERAHEHGHLDAVLIPASRGQLAAPPLLLPAASPEPEVAPTSTLRVARERAPPRASPGSADPSHPRAPPHA